MNVESDTTNVLNALRSSEDNLVLRSGASVSTGAFLAGVGMILGWIIGDIIDSPLSFDESMAFAMLAAALLWCTSLWIIWRPVRRAGAVLWPSLVTLLIASVAGFGMWLAERLIGPEEEIVMTAVGLCGGGLIIIVWLPPAMRIVHGKPVIGADKQVSVHCPSCGYSLIGLSDLRCPECGAQFTIDQLIRAQGYGGADTDISTIRLAESAEGAEAPRRTMPD